MTGRENFEAMMKWLKPERLPFQLDLTPPVEADLRQKLGEEDPRATLGSDFVHHYIDFGESEEQWRAAYADMGINLDEHCQFERIGIFLRYPEQGGKTPHLAQFVHPLSRLETVAQLEKLPWPDPTAARHYSGLEERLAKVRGKGKVNVLGMACTLFEDSWYLRGMEDLMEDLIDGNPIGEWLLDWMTERSIAVAKAFVRSGVDVVHLGDDVGMQRGMLMSPDFWRRHFKPRLSRVIDAVRAAANREIWVSYHSDGNIEPIIGELFELGVDILNPVQPECLDVAGTLRRHKDHGAFWGMIGTQTTMPLGKPEDVCRAVAQLVDLAREGIRIICAPTHVIEPDVPFENLLALARAPRSLRQ